MTEEAARGWCLRHGEDDRAGCSCLFVPLLHSNYTARRSQSALCTQERIGASRQEARRHTPGTRASGSEQAEFILGSASGWQAPWASCFLILTVGVGASL